MEPVSEEREYVLTVLFKDRWPREYEEFSGLDLAVKSAAQDAARPDVAEIAIWRRWRGDLDRFVPFLVVQDVAETLGLDQSGQLRAKYPAVPPEPGGWETESLGCPPRRRSQVAPVRSEYFDYDTATPQPSSRRSVTFFEYDAPPARRGIK